MGADRTTRDVDGSTRRRSSGGNAVVNISARVDYGVRVLCALAASGDPMTSEQLAAAQDLPHKFLEGILTDLRRGGLLVSKRGAEGGYWLARPADSISLTDVIGPLVGTVAEIRGQRPEWTSYSGAAEHLRTAWLVVRDRLEAVLDEVTIGGIVAGELPAGALGDVGLPPADFAPAELAAADLTSAALDGAALAAADLARSGLAVSGHPGSGVPASGLARGAAEPAIG